MPLLGFEPRSEPDHLLFAGLCTIQAIRERLRLEENPKALYSFSVLFRLWKKQYNVFQAKKSFLIIKALLFLSALNVHKQTLAEVFILENLEHDILAHNVVLKDQTKMAKALVGVDIMPDSAEVDLGSLEGRVRDVVLEVCGEVGEIRVTKTPIAFGLHKLNVQFVMDEKLGTDAIEEALSGIDGVTNAQVVDFIRTLG